MKQFYEIEKQSVQSLILRILEPSALDLEMQEACAVDGLLFKGNLMDSHGERLSYSTGSFVPLSSFLEQVLLEGRQAFRFVIPVLDRVLEAMRYRPIVLDPRLIYVDEHGQDVHFTLLPLRLEHWMYRQDDTRAFCQSLLEQLRLADCYALSGYLWSTLRQENFSLATMAQGLKELEDRQYPRPFWKRGKELPAFRTEQALMFDQSQTISVDQESAAYQGCYFEKPLQQEMAFPSDEKTQILMVPTQETETCASLEIEGQSYSLHFETSMIGRHPDCDIRLNDPSISMHHARLTTDQGRWYIQDLKSTNHSWLNGKQIIRRMRLKEGMQLQFGQVQAVFHE